MINDIIQEAKCEQLENAVEEGRESGSSNAEQQVVENNAETTEDDEREEDEETDYTTTEEDEEGSEGEEEGVVDTTAELEKLLRLACTEPKASEDSDSEEEKENKRRKKKKKRSKPQEEESSMVEGSEGEGEEVCSAITKFEVDYGEDDFSIIANREAKKIFLLTSEESCQSSEHDERPNEEERLNEEEEEENPNEEEYPNEEENLNEEEISNGEEKWANVKIKEEEEMEERRKDDLREYRISDLTAEDDDSDESVEKSPEKEKWKEEDESSGDSDDSVRYVEQVKRNGETSNNEQTHDADWGSDAEQVPSRTESSSPKGRRNIKKILKKENLQVETKQALKLETERKKRVAERQKMFESHFPDDLGSRLVLDFDPQTKEELLLVDRNLTQQLKPHQREGIRFMWNCCFESLKSLEEDSGSGCVLAHCMGLGKTLQVIALVHTVLTRNTGVHTVMIMCPLNTIMNWIHEFRKWQRGCEKKVRVVDLIPAKCKPKRMARVQSWSTEGGVLIISYEMFRTLIKKDNSLFFSKGFLDPGPDLVVCDEGHVLKNSSSALSRTISRMKTLRRIILTGTPLQNNLMEYYCMVQFVKPNILGTQREFKNRFVHPINNGQFEDSTELDVLLMKRRSHVLHTMLEGFVQRFGYYVLTPFLPEKQEYVISIALTETQGKVYRLFIDRCNQENRGLLKDFHWAQKIWTHPRVLFSQATNNPEDTRWLNIPQEEFEDVRSSGKLLLLFEILQRSKEIGDKVLVFSQSLSSLDVIEFFLRKANEDYCSGVRTRFADRWVFGQDYSRLDGSTSSETRDSYCKQFNSEDNVRFRLFLVSTKAGGLGINLVAANRVVVFDASWNPTHDVQSIFRVYRFGQKKPCFIYRFLAASTMEEKVYRRQVTKLSLAHRILDEHQIERHYTMGNLQELYTYDPIPRSEFKSPKFPKDKLFAEVLANHRDVIVGYHEHDSLLENKEDEELTEEERRAAWEDYEKEKQLVNYPMNFPPEGSTFFDRITNEGLNAIQTYKEGIPAFQNVQVIQPENRVCKIVDVRTLHEEGDNAERMERMKLLEYGRSLGLSPYEDESLDRYCKRIDEELKKICQWGMPGAVIQGVVGVTRPEFVP